MPNHNAVQPLHLEPSNFRLPISDSDRENRGLQTTRSRWPRNSVQGHASFNDWLVPKQVHRDSDSVILDPVDPEYFHVLGGGQYSYAKSRLSSRHFSVVQTVASAAFVPNLEEK